MTSVSTYALPGITVQPEGITHGAGRDFYVGAIPDGTIFRGQLDTGEVSVWQPPGLDDRTCVLGLALHDDRHIVACGGSTGHLFVYDLATGKLIARRSAPSRPTLLNDVWVTGDVAYLTDSEQAVVWRMRLGDPQGEMEVFADLSFAGPRPYLNGIVATADESALLVSAQGAGTLWRVELANGSASQVALPDGYAFAADGLLLLDERTLFGVCHEGDPAVFFLAALELNRSATAAVPIGRWVDDRLDTPTTIARAADGRLLVVNSQLRHAEPELPFRVTAIDVPTPRAIDVPSPRE